MIRAKYVRLRDYGNAHTTFWRSGNRVELAETSDGQKETHSETNNQDEQDSDRRQADDN